MSDHSPRPEESAGQSSTELDHADRSTPSEDSESGDLTADGKGEEDSERSATLSEDFYVTLQPLTLELVARQFERLGIKFARRGEALHASWADFEMTTRIIGNALNISVLLATGYPSGMVGALQARCNWWNESQLFLKAYTQVTSFQLSQEAKNAHGVAAIVRLDMDLPCKAGIAPVQLQALMQDVLRNVRTFCTTAQLDALQVEPGWEKL